MRDSSPSEQTIRKLNFIYLAYYKCYLFLNRKCIKQNTYNVSYVSFAILFYQNPHYQSSILIHIFIVKLTYLQFKGGRFFFRQPFCCFYKLKLITLLFVNRISSKAINKSTILYDLFYFYDTVRLNCNFHAVLNVIKEIIP